jgi:hypothetical protein
VARVARRKGRLIPEGRSLPVLPQEADKATISLTCESVNTLSLRDI